MINDPQILSLVVALLMLALLDHVLYGDVDHNRDPILMTCVCIRSKKRILLDLCVSSLRRGHANLLCIVPSLFRATVLLPGLIIIISHLPFYMSLSTLLLYLWHPKKKSFCDVSCVVVVLLWLLFLPGYMRSREIVTTTMTRFMMVWIPSV
jgi:hypothetical protein